MSLEDDFARYKRERPSYVRLVEALKARVESASRAAGLRCTIQGRAKALDSFVKKLIVHPQPYNDVYDKAGLRIVVTYPDERDAAAELVRSTLRVSWERDFV